MAGYIPASHQFDTVPDYYQDYVDPTRPVYDTFADPAEYDRAMAEWVALRNGGRAFAAPTETPYTMPGGGQATWYTAGTNNDVSVGQRYANELNRKWLSNQSMGDMGIRNWIEMYPDRALAAYMAVDMDGRPVLDPSLMAFLEDQFGVRPQGPAADNLWWMAPAADPGQPGYGDTPGAGPDVDPPGTGGTTPPPRGGSMGGAIRADTIGDPLNNAINANGQNAASQIRRPAAMTQGGYDPDRLREWIARRRGGGANPRGNMNYGL